MVDKILRWYVDGNISRAKTQVGGVHKMDDDYRPLSVNMNVRIAGNGDVPTLIDIMDDGVSIFESQAAILNDMTDKTWTTLKDGVLREGSIIRLDIAQTARPTTCHDLTVELELEKV